MSYLHRALADPRDTHQMQPIPGREAEMVQNSEGGHVFAVEDFARLRRFLVLGTEGGSFYAGEAKLTKENADVVLRCLKQDGPRTVQEIVDISVAGRAPKNDQAIYALALACVPEYADENTRRVAFAAVTEVCRTGTHLFQFCSFVDDMRSWGQGLMKAVASWYTQKDDHALAYQMVKYQSREGWTHADVLRSAHPKDAKSIATAWSDTGEPYDFDENRTRAKLYDWACGRKPEQPTIGWKAEDPRSIWGEMPDAIIAYERVRQAKTVKDVVKAIEFYGNSLPHEAIPSELKANAEVWGALLEAGLPLTAMIRNLANMTRYGVLGPNSDGERIVRETLASEEKIVKARVHPFAILNALKTYDSGGHVTNYWYGGNAPKSQHTWQPNHKITAALDKAFYLSFQNVEPSNKRFVIGVDVSGSMGAYMNNSFITCAEGAAALAMVTEATEPYCATRGFAGSFVDLKIHGGMSLREATDAAHRSNFGRTDCAVPIKWAKANNVPADTFVIITDNETYAGHPHPSQALKQYRKETGIDAKMVVIGMASNGFSIADPKDPGMLDVVGFDTATAKILSDFSAGRI